MRIFNENNPTSSNCSKEFISFGLNTSKMQRIQEALNSGWSITNLVFHNGKYFGKMEKNLEPNNILGIFKPKFKIFAK